MTFLNQVDSIAMGPYILIWFASFELETNKVLHVWLWLGVRVWDKDSERERERERERKINVKVQPFQKQFLSSKWNFLYTRDKKYESNVMW